MILMIDNYDSFTYNLVDYIGKQCEAEINVYRHDEIDIDQIRALSPQAIVISPGPKRPEDAGVSNDVIREFGKQIPMLGVCLGHQCIAQVFGGEIVSAKTLMHGKTSMVSYETHPLFDELDNPFVATRYHSLSVAKDSFPKSLEILAVSDDDQEIMALCHREYPIYGVQFHPESICTDQGLVLLRNFLRLSGLL
ncbi:MAG: anthranilate/aminodeoxychorismate synthase component II [Actinobacteria bacterium]|nr:anthranilate/aminodeoxychorismate synthase component II [Actinomycetota bacterium]